MILANLKHGVMGVWRPLVIKWLVTIQSCATCSVGGT